MKKLILIVGLLVGLSGLIRSVDAQDIVGYGSTNTGEIHLIGLDENDTLTYGESISSFTPTIGGIPTNISFVGLAIDPLGETLYGSTSNGKLYSIDIATGAATDQGDMGINTGSLEPFAIEAMDFNFTGDELWVVDLNDDSPTIYKINNFNTTDPIGNPISATPVQTLNPSFAPVNVVRAMAAFATNDVWVSRDNFIFDFQSVDTDMSPGDQGYPDNTEHIGFLDNDLNRLPFLPGPKIMGMDRDINGVLYGLANDGGIFTISELDDPLTDINGDPVARMSNVGTGNTGGHVWQALAIATAGSSGGSGDNQPPVADAGDNLQISSSQQLSTTLNGTASDPDVDDVLQYRWLEGVTELMDDWAPVGEGGSAPLDLSSLPYFTLGQHTLKLEVSDGTVTADDTMILTIDNSPPEVAPSGGGTFQLGNDITLNGNVSDFDGDGLNYHWFEAATTDGDFAASFINTTAGGYPVVLPGVFISGGLSLGIHNITLEADDGINAPVAADITITVVDNEAPTITLTANQCILWPPNHKLRDIVIQATTTDDSPVTLSATVTSTEPLNDTGDGNTDYDWTEPVITMVDQENYDITLQLRAERKGNGTGRTYTITVRATDSSGNWSEAEIVCVAPHDKGKN